MQFNSFQFNCFNGLLYKKQRASEKITIISYNKNKLCLYDIKFIALFINYYCRNMNVSSQLHIRNEKVVAFDMNPHLSACMITWMSMLVYLV